MNKDAFSGPHGHDFSNLAEVLLRYRDDKIVYVPNPGNVGDALIAFGAYLLFERLGLDVENGRKDAVYPGRVVIFGGGGAMIGRYPDADEFLRNNHAVCKALVLLPHTVRAYGDLLSTMDARCTIFAREQPTMAFIQTHCTGGAQTMLGHDLAFFVSRNDLMTEPWDLGRLNSPELRLSWARMVAKFFVLSRIKSRHLNIFRLDDERTDVDVPDFNYDVATYFWPGDLSRPAAANALKMLRLVMDMFKTVETNRLHMTVMAGLLGKPVVMRDNNYGKNSSIYTQSIDGYFPNITFSTAGPAI